MVVRADVSAPVPRVTVVVLNWNGGRDTLACLASLAQQDYAATSVLVIDNGSTDGSVAEIARHFPAVQIVENGQNLGYARGNNTGIVFALMAGADYILLLNNDTVVAPDCVSELMKAALQYPRAAALGAKIYYFTEPERIWYAGARWDRDSACTAHIGQGEVDTGSPYSAVSETDYACGCAVLLQVEAVHKVGLLDYRYFLIWEEVDWCYRARRAGFEVLFVPTARVWHKISTSFGGSFTPLSRYFWWRNRLLWMEKNLPFAERFSIYRRCLLKEILGEGMAYLKLRSAPESQRLPGAALQGVLDYLVRRFGDSPAWLRASR
ncbi:glycosyltransferase family 2 protein [Gloeobacter kilaueensis]|uniref:Glycosyl transferase family 2 n=1 Tax=Gloeobacter kilaueensis (strain ATCC BAA-2537 / CCAP 1431/1 / ULC 316 / JS1) TaxID=1183438 RepID=U5QPU5_GLOK1|nr:glycosyltransferase family 2 protein [Gloeobacter kilaueensis]AGY59715.1 glycosyl transferase family 2 [Gloeobacter kilaueensis JS1]